MSGSPRLLTPLHGNENVRGHSSNRLVIIASSSPSSSRHHRRHHRVIIDCFIRRLAEAIVAGHSGRRFLHAQQCVHSAQAALPLDCAVCYWRTHVQLRPIDQSRQAADATGSCCCLLLPPPPLLSLSLLVLLCCCCPPLHLRSCLLLCCRLLNPKLNAALPPRSSPWCDSQVVDLCGGGGGSAVSSEVVPAPVNISVKNG